MNLKTTIELLAGGRGSGCNPRKGKCGRNKGLSKEKSTKISYKVLVDAKHGTIKINHDPDAGTFFVVKDNNYNIDKVAELFEKKNLKLPFKVPSKFDYVWIDEIKLNNKYRGKGLGGQVLDEYIKGLKKPTLIALNPGEISTNVKIGSLLKFYKKNGFSILLMGKDHYGFKLVK